MTTYEFPRARGGRYTDDAPGRMEFLAPRRRDLDAEGAHVARTAGRPRRGRGPAGGLAAPPAGRTDLWLPIGPSYVVGGQAAGRPRITGRVKSLAVHENGQRIYAAAANGGIWYSRNGGDSWHAIGGFAPTPGLTVPLTAHRHTAGAIHVRWRTEADDEVFVGTGEPVRQGGRPGGSLGGLGVLSAVGPADDPVVTDPWTLESQAEFAGAGFFRIVEEPDGGAILGATTRGLFQRGATAADPWTRVTGAPFNTFEGRVSSVLWTAATGAVPERIWAWVWAGTRRGLWFRNVDVPNTTWRRIAIAGLAEGRGVLAAPATATTVYAFHDRGDDSNNLYHVDATVDPPRARRVTGVPNVVQTQGFYDMAIAVDPANPARVVLGGSFTDVADPAGANVNGEGAIWAGTVSAPPNPAFNGATHIGIGVHADVHDLVFSNAGARLWTGCDGGTFRSDDSTRAAGFYARNDGKPVTEPNYLAVHPRLEGYIVAGLQDNGILERASSTLWRHTGDGDGGGIALRPDAPDTFVRQFFQAFWGAISPLERGGVPFATWQAEFDASEFYSQPAGIVHTRGAGPGAVQVGQVLIGTTRVWMTQDFGATWATLPRGTDALLPAYNANQDRLGSAVVACRWQGPDQAWVLTGNEVYLLSRTPGTDTAASVGTWAPRYTELRRSFASPAGSARALVKRAPVWTDLAVDPDVGGTRRGPRGAFYLGTVGSRTNAAVDTLYWFDGDQTLHATGLRSEAGGVPAPVTSIAPDPTNPDHVYVGTSVGVWRGERTFPGGVPDWDWEPVVNGLPEAAVEDLSMFSDDGVRLLRAAVMARGVWEMRLGQDVEDLTYVRVHEDDMRHRDESILVNRNLVGERSWHASPDIRPRPASRPTARPAAGAPWTFVAQPPGDVLRQFQAALRSRFADPRFRANGLWDTYFDRCLLDRGAPAAGGVASVDGAFYDTVMVAPHDTAELWSTAVPTEADLHELVPPIAERPTHEASMTLTPAPHRVDVVVHRRGLLPIAGNEVRVTLLKWTDPDFMSLVRRWLRARPNDPQTWFTGNVPWADAVNEVLDSAAGTTTRTFGEGWSFVGTNAASRRRTPTTELDNLSSGIVTFDLDLTGVPENTVYLLAAVIRADGGSNMAPNPLRDLTLGNPHVAVRSLRVHS